MAPPPPDRWDRHGKAWWQALRLRWWIRASRRGQQGGSLLRGVASGAGLLWVVVVAGLTGGDGFTDLRKEKKKFLCWVIKKFLCWWFYHFMFFNILFFFFFGNHFLEFLIKIIFIKKSTITLLFLFQYLKIPTVIFFNSHIFLTVIFF
jgi:hypothetical protein